MIFTRKAHRKSEARPISLKALIILAAGILFTGMLAPLASGQSKETGREKVTLEGSYSDAQFLAGKLVRISAEVADDVFAAGRYVTFEDAKVRNVVVAGYDVELRSGTTADLYAAAGRLGIGGTIEDDLVAGARTVRISSSGAIGGDVRLAAESIDMEGRIGGSLRAAARRITISGEIAGKADLFAERIVIAAGARIAGDLIYRSGSEPEIADGATIVGEVRRIDIDMPDFRSLAGAMIGIGLLIAVAWAIVVLALVAVIQLAFPNVIARAAEHLRTNPWSNLGIGIAIHLLVGILVGLLFASIAGIPAGAALLMTAAVAWLLGLVTVSACIGLFIRGRLRGSAAIGTAGRVGWTLAGTIVVGLVALVPLLGAVVAALAVASGFGAAARELWRRMRAA